MKVTVKSPGATTSNSQGVLQLGPSDVVASAPPGVDWSWTVPRGGGEGLLEISSLTDDEPHPAKIRPHAVSTIA
jgi:hypothetical protein